MATLYDRFSQIVYSVALRVLGDTAAAEDVMQEVFLQLWRNPEAFNSSRGSLGAWLAVITRHRAIDHLRRRKTETDIEDVVVAVDARIDDEADKHRAKPAKATDLARQRAEVDAADDRQPDDGEHRVAARRIGHAAQTDDEAQDGIDQDQ